MSKELKDFLIKCCCTDIELLRFLFPGYGVFIDFIPENCFWDKVIFVTDIPVPINRFKDIIYVRKSSNRDLVDREIFLEFLECKKIRFSKKLREFLVGLDDFEFWRQVKLLYFMKKIKVNSFEKVSTVFDLFKCLFGNYENSFQILLMLHLNYRIVFASLVTMMSKTKGYTGKISKQYFVALKNNEMHLNKFKINTFKYIKSKQTFIDFLEFLFNNSLDSTIV